MSKKVRTFIIEQLNRMGYTVKTWTVPNYRFVNRGLMVYFIDPDTDDGIFLSVHNVMIRELTEQIK